jgi:hypothetical protein
MEYTLVAQEGATALGAMCYPKIEARHGNTRWRYATSMSFEGTAFLELSHHVSTEVYVDTRKWTKSWGK